MIRSHVKVTMRAVLERADKASGGKGGVSMLFVLIPMGFHLHLPDFEGRIHLGLERGGVHTFRTIQETYRDLRWACHLCSADFEYRENKYNFHEYRFKTTNGVAPSIHIDDLNVQSKHLLPRRCPSQPLALRHAHYRANECFHLSKGNHRKWVRTTDVQLPNPKYITGSIYIDIRNRTWRSQKVIRIPGPELYTLTPFASVSLSLSFFSSCKNSGSLPMQGAFPEYITFSNIQPSPSTLQTSSTIHQTPSPKDPYHPSFYKPTPPSPPPSLSLSQENQKRDIITGSRCFTLCIGECEC